MTRSQRFHLSFRRSGAFRCLLAVVALFYAAQHAALVAHLALVPHSVCREHGELIDVDARSSAAAREAAAARADHEHSSASQSGRHEHDHCELLAHFRQRLSSRICTAIPAFAAVELSAPSLQGADASPPGIALYLLAPKSSPPV